MGKWSENNLGSICNIVKGKQLNKLNLEKSGDFPCINGGVGPSGYTHKFNTLENTITISEGGNSCGYVNFLKTKFWSGGHCYSILNIDEDLNKDFLFYALKGRESNIMRLRVGSGLPNIQQKEINNFIIAYPQEKPEQTRIAEILSTTDAAIEQTEKLIAKSQRIKTGLIQDLFTYGIDEHGNIRSKATHKFVIKNGIEVPEEWEVFKFETLIEKIDSGWSPICHSISAMVDEWGSLKTTAITWDGYNPDENKRLPFDLKPIESIEVKLDDILITRVGPRNRVGVVVHVNDPRAKLMISDNMLRLKIIKNTNVFLPFLPLMLGSEFIQNIWKNKIAGLAEAQVVINQPTINSTPVLLPKVPEQIAIVEKIVSIGNNINVLKLSLDKLHLIKTGLMEDLLSGRVRVKVNEN